MVKVLVNDDLYMIDNVVLENALQKQIPMDPNTSTSQWNVSHYCPVCGNILKSPGLEQFQNGSYCDKCGQKIKWGDCHD